MDRLSGTHACSIVMSHGKRTRLRSEGVRHAWNELGSSKVQQTKLYAVHGIKDALKGIHEDSNFINNTDAEL